MVTGELILSLHLPSLQTAPAKRARVASVPLSSYPSTFVHGSHPPTRALYITNLRRPLADGTLADHLSSFGDLDLEASVGKESCGWWLSPVKSHAFVVYTTLESAVTAYTALQGCTTFPEEPAAGKTVPALTVTFLPPGPIPGLIKQEVKAWTEEGRRKLELLVEEVDGEWELKYKGVGDVNLGRGGALPLGALAVGPNARRGLAAPPPRAFGVGSSGAGAPFGRPSNGFGGPGFSSRDGPSNGFRGPPPSAPPYAASGSGGQNGFSRPRPPYDSVPSNGGYRDAPRAPYAPSGPDRNGGRYDSDRDRDRGGSSYRGDERTTAAQPRLSWTERERDGSRGGGRDDRERDRDYRPRERDYRDDRDRDRRDDYSARDRDRRSPYSDRRRD